LDKIASLDMRKNLLRDAGVKMIMESIQSAKTQIVSLNFSNNELSYKGLESICKALLGGAGKYLNSLYLNNDGPL
jgi:Leucine Rich repeat